MRLLQSLVVAGGCVLRACAMVLLAVGSMGLAHPSRAVERIAPLPTGIGRLGDDMGGAVSLFGDTAAVGAPGTYVDNAGGAGVVDIYRFQNGAWQEEARLPAPVPQANTRFGSTLALGQDLLVAGAGANLYTYERTGSTWQQVDDFPAFYWTQIGLSGDTLASGGTVFVRSGSGWQVQATLAPDADDEAFGFMVIDGDLIVADGFRFVGLSTYYHAVYFFSRSGTQWTREAKVPVGETLSNATVSLAISGSTALVGAPAGSLSQTPNVRVFDRDGTGNWVDQGILDTGGTLSGTLPVAIEGDVAVLGSPSDWTAYTFTRTNGTWSRDQHFNDPMARCFAAVAVSGSTLLAGCPYSYLPTVGYGIADFFSLASAPPAVTESFGHGDARANENFGWRVAADGGTILSTSILAAYFFDHTASGWTQTVRFPTPATHIGAASAAIDGDTAAIGYPLQVYPGGTSEVDVYARAAGTWSPQAVIPSPSSEENSYFGAALALGSGVLVVTEQNSATGSSTCHVYRRSGAVWQAAPDLSPTGGSTGDWFGWSLSMSGNTLVVGAPGTDFGIETDAGAAYVFVWSGTAWVQQVRLTAPLIAVRAGFGISVAIKGNTIVVGSNSDLGPTSSTRGEVNVYRRSGNNWSWQATLAPPGGGTPGDYGYAVAISDTEDRVIATAPFDFAHDPYAGVAYSFAFDGAAWSPTATIHAFPPFPPSTNDWFGVNAAFFGEDYVIGASADGVGGAVYVGPTTEAIFADGFDEAP